MNVNIIENYITVSNDCIQYLLTKNNKLVQKLETKRQLILSHQTT